MRRRWPALAVVWALRAFAHDADVVYVDAASTGAPDVLQESVTLTAQTLGQLAPVDADDDGTLTQADLDARGAALAQGVWEQAPLTAGGRPCARQGERAWVREGFVELAARFRCGPGELRQDFRFLAVLPTNYRVVLGTQLDGERNRAFAQGTLTSLAVPRARPRSFSPARFWLGWGEGLRRALGLDALALLALLFVARGGLVRQLGALLVGLLALAVGSTALLSEPWPAVAVGLAALVLAAGRRRTGVRAAAIAVGCLGLGLRGGGGELATVAGLWAGSAAVLAGVGLPAAVVGRLLERRPALQARVAFALAALALASVGFRLAGLPGP